MKTYRFKLKDKLFIAMCGVVGLALLLTLGYLSSPHCQPGQCPGHVTRWGIGYCDRESCLKHNPWANHTVDLFGEEKK